MRSFSVNWDYRCPFARNANELVVAGLEAGADWDVSFVPFSLGQVHVEEGQTPIWDRPADDSGLLALQVGTAVRDTEPERFRSVHIDLFALRHDRSGDLRDADLIKAVLIDHGVDAEHIFSLVEGGDPLQTVRKEHEAAARGHAVWGVPTFVRADEAAFVRLMDRPRDGAHARRSIDRVLDLLEGFVEMNEFKHTSIAR
ncbi:MAG: DsbA family protein [Acidimicrobiales bacterium]